MPNSVSPPIQFAILSFAHYHANFWSQAINQSAEAQLIGIWDEDPGRGEAAARDHGTKFWPELDALLAACEAVGVTSKTAHHADLIESAAAHKCHILCEKPLATSMEECDRVEAAVAAADVFFMQSFPKRFDPVNHELKRLVETGSLGRITLMRVRHGHLYGIISSDYWEGWTSDAKLLGGGSLIDEGVHGADFIRWMFGEPDSVMAMLSNSGLGHGSEDLGVAVYRYDDGPLCELVASDVFAAGDNSVEIFGLKGTAVVSGIDLASRDVTTEAFLKVCLLEDGLTDPTTRRWMVSDIEPGFLSTPAFHQQNVVQFLNALITGTEPANTLEDGRRSLQMILSAYSAAQTGRTVRIPR